MSVDRIKQALTAVRYPVSSSLTLPPECYHDDGWLEHEMNCLFRRGWFGIGRRDQWHTPGDYQAIEVAGVPIVVIMDKDGKLQALSNSCLHRSSRIMTGTGSCKAMVCPFHGWCYDTRGSIDLRSQNGNRRLFLGKAVQPEKVQHRKSGRVCFSQPGRKPGFTG